jgi:hypothetical protein
MCPKRNEKKLWLLAGSMFLLACGCNPLALWARINPFARVSVVEHPQNQPAVDKSIFETADCSETSYGRRQCEPKSPIGQLGCNSILEPLDILGGLDPALPLMRCQAAFTPGDERLALDDFLYNSGCLMPEYIRYIVWQDGNYVLLKNLTDVQSIYAPIQSPEEALSYAAAVTGFYADFNLKYDRQLRYHVKTIEETFVEEIQDGYRVHLFHDKFCGCGPHPTSAVAVDVHKDGSIKIGELTPFYEDPKMDGLCID